MGERVLILDGDGTTNFTGRASGTQSIDSVAQPVMTFILKYRMHIIVLSLLLVIHSLEWSLGHVSLDTIVVAFSVACVIAFAYLFNKATDTEEDMKSRKGEEISPQSVRNTYVAASVLAILPLCWLWLYPTALGLFVVVALAGFLYSSRRAFGFRVKDMFLLKNLFSAGFFWAMPVAISPATWRGSMSSLDAVHFAFVYLIALMIEIFWDMRDVDGDRQAGIRTIPNTCGFLFTKILVTAVGVIATVVAATNAYPLVVYPGIALLVLFVIGATRVRPAYYYHMMIFVWIIAVARELVF